MANYKRNENFRQIVTSVYNNKLIKAKDVNSIYNISENTLRFSFADKQLFN